MTQYYLILAHDQPLQLRRLIEKLQHADAYFFVHIDAKAALPLFQQQISAHNIIWITERVSIKWGGYSMVQATVNGLKSIVQHAKGQQGYIHLLSAQDYPLVTTDDLHLFFSQQQGKAFMEYYPIYTEWTEAVGRITQYHLTEYQFPGKYFVQQLLNKWLPQRRFPMNMLPVGRSQWFSITISHAAYLVNALNNVALVRFFKHTWGSDEFVFQTLLYNSPYQSDMVNNNLRYIDWSEGKPSPKTFDINDSEALMHCGKLFARKFQVEKSSEVLNYIDTHPQLLNSITI